MKPSLEHKLAAARDKEHPVLVLAREDYDEGMRIPDEIAEVRHLYAVSAFGAATIPESIGELAQLDSLQVFDGTVAHVPASIGKLQRMRSLDLHGNRSIATLPDELGALAALESLDLRNNAIAALPEAIGGLGRLRRLLVDHNPLVRLPAALGRLRALEELWASHCKLEDFPDGAFPSLQRAELSGNALATLPLALTRCPRLRHLIVFRNHIAELPPEVGGLVALEELELSSNRLTTLPDELLRLPRLRHLDTGPGIKWPKGLRQQVAAANKRFKRGNPGVVDD